MNTFSGIVSGITTALDEAVDDAKDGQSNDQPRSPLAPPRGGPEPAVAEAAGLDSLAEPPSYFTQASPVAHEAPTSSFDAPADISSGFDTERSPDASPEVTDLAARLAFAERKNARLTKALESLREEAATAQRRAAAECDTLAVSLEAAHKQIAALEEAALLAQVETDENCAQLQTLRAVPDSLRSELAAAQAVAAQAAARIDQLEAKASAAAAAAAAAQREAAQEREGAIMSAASSSAAELRADRAEAELQEMRSLCERYRSTGGSAGGLCRSCGGEAGCGGNASYGAAVSSGQVAGESVSVGPSPTVVRFFEGLSLAFAMVTAVVGGGARFLLTLIRSRGVAGGWRVGSTGSSPDVQDKVVAIALVGGLLLGLVLSSIFSGGASAAAHTAAEDASACERLREVCAETTRKLTECTHGMHV